MDKQDQTVEVVKEVATEVSFFSSIDRDPTTGKISSEFPVFCFESTIGVLEQEIDQREGAINQGWVPNENIAYEKSSIAALKTKLDAMKNSKPKLSDATMNKLNKVRKELATYISGSMPSESDHNKGSGKGDPHLAMKRLNLATVQIDKTVAEMCNVRPDSNGKYRENSAIKAYQIISNFFGESSDISMLMR